MDLRRILTSNQTLHFSLRGLVLCNPEVAYERSSDRIEKQVVLKAPVKRVWRALTDAQEFVAGSASRVAGQFAPGVRVTCKSPIPGTSTSR